MVPRHYLGERKPINKMKMPIVGSSRRKLGNWLWKMIFLKKNWAANGWGKKAVGRRTAYWAVCDSPVQTSWNPSLELLLQSGSNTRIGAMVNATSRRNILRPAEFEKNSWIFRLKAVKMFFYLKTFMTISPEIKIELERLTSSNDSPANRRNTAAFFLPDVQFFWSDMFSSRVMVF